VQVNIDVVNDAKHENYQLTKVVVIMTKSVVRHAVHVFIRLTNAEVPELSRRLLHK